MHIHIYIHIHIQIAPEPKLFGPVDEGEDKMHSRSEHTVEVAQPLDDHHFTLLDHDNTGYNKRRFPVLDAKLKQKKKVLMFNTYHHLNAPARDDRHQHSGAYHGDDDNLNQCGVRHSRSAQTWAMECLIV
jgi:hypothetical protein